MSEEAGRTLVCSVLFVDIIGYSKKAVAEQHEIKQLFQRLLGDAPDLLKRRDRVLVDTGDGAAVVFLGDPEDALVVGIAMREHAGRIDLRMGINLGPIRLINDMNEQVNVIGDGINVTQRVMSFAEPGQLLVSRNYHDVVSRMSDHYAPLFTREGVRQDKHVREHEVYSVADSISLGGPESLTPEPLALPGAVYHRPESAEEEPAVAPARVMDAGQNMMISGGSRRAVQQALDRLLADGAKLISPVNLVGAKWLAACTHPRQSGSCTVEQFGMKQVITGSSRRAVAERVSDLLAFGAKLEGEIEEIDGVWTAVCDSSSRG